MGYSYKFGWLQMVGSLTAFAVIGRVVFKLQIGSEVLRADPYLSRCARSHSSSWELFQKSLDIRADAIIFQTGNVFYECLFSALGANRFADYAYFGFSVMALIIGCCAIV